MPRKFRRKGYRFTRRRRNYSRRLNDKAINTKIEKVIQRVSRDVAKKEDSKNFQWFQPKINVLAGTHNGLWPGPASAPWTRFNGLTDGQACLAGTLHSMKISNWGGLLENQLAVPPSSAGNELLNTLRVKSCMLDLTFCNVGAYPVIGQVMIVSIPNSSVLSGNQPSLSMFKSVTPQYSGPYSGQPRQDMPYKYTVLAKKMFRVPRSKLYTNGWKNGSNQFVDPVHTEERKRVKIFHNFKGKGRLFTIDPSGVSTQMKESQIYCLWTTDTDCATFGFCSSKFRLEKPQIQVAS